MCLEGSELPVLLALRPAEADFDKSDVRGDWIPRFVPQVGVM
jgi:hypothetical protein